MGAKLGGGGGSKKFELGQNSDINVTPFVDVMLVLLIIFMVSIPVATVSIKLDLPPAIPPPPGTKVKEPTFVSILQGGTIAISSESGIAPTSINTLTSDLARILSVPNPTEERVYIRADRTVRYGDFMAVMNQLQDGGYYQVALISEEL
jgi:biopolymer transport protein ExbD